LIYIKIDKVREMIKEGGEFGNLSAFPKAIPFPLDPSMKFSGVKSTLGHRTSKASQFI